MSLLRVEDVSIRYITGNFKDIGLKDYVIQRIQGNYHEEEFWADRHITFSLEKGDMLGIIGKNGAGKSTLLKAISQIMPPTEGKVHRKGTIAALLELSSGFDGDLTVKENTYLRGAMLGYSREFMDKTYEQIIEFAELQDFQDRPFKQLSSGMKSRLAFSIASLVQPDILILDEVLSVGDGAFRKKSEAKMREIIAGGATTILVSHSIEQIRAMCNKVLWLHKGEQIEFGDDVQGICDRYEAFLTSGTETEIKREKKQNAVKKEEKVQKHTAQKAENSAQKADNNAQKADRKERAAEQPLQREDSMKTKTGAQTTNTPPEGALPTDTGWKAKYFDLWERLTGRRLFAFYTLHYTLLFAVMCWLVFAPFREAGKTFLWTTDGGPLYYTSMTYLRQTIQSGIRDLLNGGGWTFPLYDFHLGPAKQITNAEPFRLLAVFASQASMETLYNALVIVRYYLVGLFFSLFAFRFSKSPVAICCGALSYTFCGYGIFAGVRHPHFLAVMILLPLLLLGAEKIICHEKPWLFVATVFLALVNNVYFSYMLALMVIIYFFTRVFCVSRQTEKKETITIVKQLLLYGVIGIALSGIVLIPNMLQNLESGRIGRSSVAGKNLWQYLFYGKSRYQSMLAAFLLEPRDIGYWTCLGLSIVTLPAVISLFLHRRRETRPLRIICSILTAMLLIRLVGYALSGFNTISNRWCFAYALCVSMILVVELPQLVNMEQKNFAAVAAGCWIYFGLCYFIVNKPDETSIQVFTLLGITLGMLQFTRRLGARRAMAACLLVTCISVDFSTYRMYDDSQLNYVSTFAAVDETKKNYDASQFASFAQYRYKVADNDFFRVHGTSIARDTINASFYWDINALTAYTSYLYRGYIDWENGLEIRQTGQNNLNFGIDGRLGNTSLAGIKYYVYRDGSKAPMPFGFQEVDVIQNGNSTDRILENQYYLPVGFTYSSCMTQEEYEALGAVERQEAELQSVALSGIPVSPALQHWIPDSYAEKAPLKIAQENDLTWKNGKLRVTKEKASIVLNFAGKPDCETYVRVVGLDLGNSGKRWNLSASAGLINTTARFTGNSWTYSHGQKSQILNLGYSEDGLTSCTLTFPEKGTFKLEDIEVWCMPVGHYAEWIDALREETLENVETNWRGLTGTISVSKDKILCLSIPYDSGWTAYVDGREVELMQANIGWMAVELAAGEHTVELRYWTPGLTEGIALSISGVICLAGYIYLRKKKARKMLSLPAVSQSETNQ